MKRSCRLSIMLGHVDVGRPCTWQRKPCSAYSGAKLMPERPSFSDVRTSSTSLPIEETMPMPVMTTRRMGASLPYPGTVRPSCRPWYR